MRMVNRYLYKTVNECKNLTGTLEFMWTQSQDVLKHCLQIEEILSKVHGTNFPVIIGRKPTATGKENQTQMMPSFTVSMNGTSTTTTTTSTASSFQNNGLKEKKVTIPGIGQAVQLPNGEVRVRYNDGTQLWLDGKHQIRYQYSDGNFVNYNDSDNIPRFVREKLEQMPKILKYLMPTSVTHKFRL